MKNQVTIPLFPLGVVLLPGTILPLHIFEERYKIMIGKCLTEDREFGVVYSEESETREKGCTARILKVLKRYEDGRMDIVTQGSKRFVIHNVYEDKPYLQAEVAYFDDATEEKGEEIDELIRDGIELLRQWDSMTGKHEDYTPLLKLDNKIISFWISNSTGFTAAEKQRFLEMTSTSDRIKKSVGSLKKIVKQMKVTEQIKKIIGGNGDPRKTET
jgi:Lon protease-like protein